MSPEDFDRIRELLHDPLPPTRDGRIWSLCPIHGDTVKQGTASPTGGRNLSLKMDKGLKCFVCDASWKDILTALEKAAGIDSTADRIRRANQQPVPRAVNDSVIYYGAPVKEFTYYNESGRAVGVKGRFEPPPEWKGAPGEKRPKDFRWRRPGAKGWGGGVAPKDMPLYRAPELAGLPIDVPIWVTEGEKAAHALIDQGVEATCHAGGGGITEFGFELELLRGRHVMLWPDNDIQGRKHMAAMRSALLDIARSVTIINAAVPPKGDAADYFEMGGTLDDLMRGVVLEPTCDLIEDDHIIARLPSDHGNWAVDFDNLRHVQGAIECDITISKLGDGVAVEPWTQRINVLSSSARESLVRQLEKHFGGARGTVGPNWTELMQTAVARMRQVFEKVDTTTSLPELLTRPKRESRWLVDSMVCADGVTIWFGTGASAKSMTAQQLSLCLVIGTDLGSWHCPRTRVLYLDYEDEDAEFGDKMRRLLEGMNIPMADDPEVRAEMLAGFHYRRGGVPLKDQVATILRIIEEHGIGLLIIDSAGPACGGSMNDEQNAIAFFQATRRLNIPVLVISHISKEAAEAGKTDQPFGSTYWHLLARRTWYFERVNDNDMVIETAIRLRKRNRGPAPDQGLRWEFTGKDSGPIYVDTFTPAGTAAVTGNHRALVHDAIAKSPASQATVKEIAEKLGWGQTLVLQVLKANDDLFLERPGQGRAPTRWAIKAREW